MTSDHPLARLLLNELLEKLGQPALDEKADVTCYICSDTYLSGESPEFPVKLPCGHTAGSRCMLKWLSPLSSDGHNNCPFCRASFFHEWDAEHFAPPARQANPVRTTLEALPSGLPSMEALIARRQEMANPMLIEIREREMAFIDGRNLFPQQPVHSPSLQEEPTSLHHQAQNGTLNVQTHPQWVNFSRPRATSIELPADGMVESMVRLSVQLARQTGTNTDPAGTSSLPGPLQSPFISNTYQPYNQQRRADTNFQISVTSAEYVNLDQPASSDTTRDRAATVAPPADPTLADPPVRALRSFTSPATLAGVSSDLDSDFDMWQAYWASENMTRATPEERSVPRRQIRSHGSRERTYVGQLREQQS